MVSSTVKDESSASYFMIESKFVMLEVSSPAAKWAVSAIKLPSELFPAPVIPNIITVNFRPSGRIQILGIGTLLTSSITCTTCKSSPA
eukprot:CAMPEP_0115058744 /NCGR_PEP_ID=MMETSP0227-20121206/6525_1 /TAXON_ID=89957 /ORGANISM="Polarella glacialis, Strain CCMP 1383" /LENGTH=87 /DNA_ID=CAMNT_0002443775 /DNA_START=298 /DNA_END=558 /DNA_ORIENTATION=-